MLQGPLATVQATAHEAERGLQSLVFMLALISLGLAVFNALPLPALDGGRTIFLVYEGITRRKVSPRVEGMIHGIGLLLLLGRSWRYRSSRSGDWLGGRELRPCAGGRVSLPPAVPAGVVRLGERSEDEERPPEREEPVPARRELVPLHRDGPPRARESSPGDRDIDPDEGGPGPPNVEMDPADEEVVPCNL